MARLQDTITLVPVPRSLVDDVVRALLDTLENLPFANGVLDVDREFVGDVRLVEGEHLTAGARYRIVPPDQTDDDLAFDARVVSWDRTGTKSIEVKTDIDGQVVTTRVDLEMDDRRLHVLRVTGDYQGRGSLSSLQRATWEAEVLLDEWFATLAPKTSPISIRVTHPLAHASLTVDRATAKDGRWIARNDLRVRGRRITRPFAALGLLFFRRRLRRFFRQALTTTEVAWNDAVPGMVERGLQERVTVHNQANITSLSREWTEAYIAALHQGIEELHFENGRLVDTSGTDTSSTETSSTDTPAEVTLLEGEHIRPGARYHLVIEQLEDRQVDSVDLKVVAWDPEGPSRIEFSSPDGAQTGSAEIDSARKPTAIRAAFTGRAEDQSELALTGEVNLDLWWASVTDSRSSGPAIKVTAQHALAEATMTLTPSPPEAPEKPADQDDEQADRARWPTHISVAVEGRQWTRPLVAVAGLVAADAVTLWLGSLAAQAAESWDGVIARTTGTDPAEAARRTLHHLFFAEEQGPRPS